MWAVLVEEGCSNIKARVGCIWRRLHGGARQASIGLHYVLAGLHHPYPVQPPEVLAAQSEDLSKALVPFSCCDPRIISDFIQSVTAASDVTAAAAAEDNAAQVGTIYACVGTVSCVLVGEVGLKDVVSNNTLCCRLVGNDSEHGVYTTRKMSISYTFFCQGSKIVANTLGTTYIYETFFRPYVASHETEIDRSLLELKKYAKHVGLKRDFRLVVRGAARNMAAILNGSYIDAEDSENELSMMEYVGRATPSVPAPTYRGRETVRSPIPSCVHMTARITMSPRGESCPTRKGKQTIMTYVSSGAPDLGSIEHPTPITPLGPIKALPELPELVVDSPV
ncbi:putative HVA22-like protein g [Platanthera guangdongensis]|uniref:HVA22-like protein g n=1 Tax=Platanthera guangdongensis TaxID=2320717 RepID=A0ABR2MXQ3_9ASPA